MDGNNLYTDSENESMQNPNMPLSKPNDINHSQQNEGQNIPKSNDGKNLVMDKPYIGHREKIMNIEGIFIKQKLYLSEEAVVCTKEKECLVYRKVKGKIKKTGKAVYKCKENSSICAKNCLSNACRPLRIKVQNLANDEQYTRECMVIDRQCTCSFLCLSRPSANIYFTEDGSSTYLGKLLDEFDCCNYNYSIYNKHDNKVFTILTACCAPALLCQGFPCKPCQKVAFEIYNSNNILIATLEKKNRDCLKSEITENDHLGIEFPLHLEWENRSLLLASLMFIELLIFEDNPEINRNN